MQRKKLLFKFGVSALLCLPTVAVAQDTESTSSEDEATPPSAYEYERPVAQDTRPDLDFAYAVGLGWNLPTELLIPNAASMRIRFGSLALEPLLIIGGRAGKTETWTQLNPPGGPNGEPDTDEDLTSGFNAALGANVRYAVASRGPVDLVALGNATFSLGNSVEDRNVDDESQLDKVTTRRRNLSLGWGLGVEWFITKRIALSADAINPLFSWTRETRIQEQEQTVVDQRARNEVRNTSTSFDYGLNIDPTIRAMVHLYF